ncbi:hypothetical protein [Mycobacterium sp. NPDC050041]|uniref:hypothetical protein n=1 Tax=Mycobacterium sp. NPDC050041 TaxID=3364293 RepID=UPI003C2EEF41
MEDVFVGSEAVSRGALTRGQLRWHYRPIHPDVYISRASIPSLAQRTAAAWLWSKRRGVVAGLAASALHGARVSDDADVELIWRCGRPPPGIVARKERIDPDEITEIGGLPVTTPSRTVLDLARHAGRDTAVVNMDALAHAAALTRSDVEPLIDRYRGGRGVDQARAALELMDGGSASAVQTMVRLKLMAAGLPAPRTQIPVTDGTALAHVALGYEAPKVGVVFGDEAPDVVLRSGWTMVSTTHAFNIGGLICLVRAAVIERGYPLWRLRAEQHATG